MISVERTDDNFPCKRSLISRAWDESFTITSNTMRHWWEEALPQYRRNGRKGIEQRNRKPTLLARANYDPTWRVKGNPICITRRASYRQRLRYLHYTHTLKDLFFFFPLVSSLSVDSPGCCRSGPAESYALAENLSWLIKCGVKEILNKKTFWKRERVESLLCFSFSRYSRNFTFHFRFTFFYSLGNY